jgi:sugar-specific transcriptional regulator TrmB
MLDAATHASLVALGLTDLEAHIYAVLLQKSPVTGYAIAKALGKPTANVYKALDTLAAKGAVEFDDGRTRRCRPVPPDVLMSGLEERFRRHRDRVEVGLRRLPGPDRDTRIYHLHDADQVYARCRRLLDSAQQVALLDLFVMPLEVLRPSIESAVARGVAVAIKAYEEIEIEGANVVVEPERDWIRTRWPAQWINMVVDGSEMLLALLAADGRDVVQAFWSSSPFLAWIHFSGVGSELLETGLRAGGIAQLDHDQRRALAAWHRRYIVGDAPGYARLRAQLGLLGPPGDGPEEE